VGAGDHRVEARERYAVVDLQLLVRRCGQHVRDVGAVGHLLDPDRQRQIAHAHSDVHESLPQSHAAGSTGRLDVDRRNAGHAELVRHERAEVLLTDELSSGHATHVDRVQLVRARFVQRL
jgi:hypothetical protein